MKNDVQQRINEYHALGIPCFERTGLIMTTLTGREGSLQFICLHETYAVAIDFEMASRKMAVPIMVHEGSPWRTYLVTADLNIDECMKLETSARVTFMPPGSTLALPTPGRTRARWIRTPDTITRPQMSAVLDVIADRFRVVVMGAEDA